MDLEPPRSDDDEARHRTSTAAFERTIDGNASREPQTPEQDENTQGSARFPLRRSETNLRSIAGSSDKRARDILEPCVICLEPITERAIAAPCNHLSFDFLCLASWLQEKASCPLCKADVVSVQYDWRAPDDFKTFSPKKPASTAAAVTGEASSTRQAGSSELAIARPSPSPSLLSRNLPSPRRGTRWHPSASASAASRSESSSSDPALLFRRQIYARNRFSQRIGSNALSGHRDFAARDFTLSSSLQSRARIFLRRELVVFSFLDTPQRGYLVEYIVAVLRAFDVKGADGKAAELLAEFLGRRNAVLLLHELEAWLRSPWTALVRWDREVQYGTESDVEVK